MRTSPAAETALFSALLEAAADAIVVIDEGGIIRQANRASGHVFGYEISELLGSSVAMLMPQEHARNHDQYIGNYLETGESKIIGIGRRVEGQRADGSTFPLELSVGEGRFTGERLFVGIVRDLSEEQGLLEAVRERESELQRMLDSALVPTALLDPKGRVGSTNQALESFLASPVGDDSRLADFVAAEDRDRFVAELGQVLEREGSCLLHALRFDGKSKRPTADVYLAAMPSRSEDPGDAGVVVQLVDRTAQLAAEEAERRTRDRLAHYHRVSLLGALAAGIAHEVSQPLGAIANYVQAGRNQLGNDPPRSEDALEVLGKIGRQAERASSVISHLRSLAASSPVERHPVDPAALVDEVVRLARRSFSDRGVELDVHLTEHLPEIHADAVQIQQVLLNLLQNALDSVSATDSARTRPRPAVTITVQPHRRGLLMCVRDCGTGIGDDIAELVFDPFFTAKGGGMGVGLSICRSIVEAHRGRLWFRNNADGPGATFFVLLPTDERALYG